MSTRIRFLKLEDGVGGRPHEVGLDQPLNLLVMLRILIVDLLGGSISFPELVEGFGLPGVVGSHDEGGSRIDLF